MLRDRSLVLMVGATALVWTAAAGAAPKLAEKGPSESDLRAFAASVVAALIEKDIELFMRHAEVPFHHPGGYFSSEAEDLRRRTKKVLDEEPLLRGVNDVKRVETWKATAPRLSDADVRSMKKVLADDDLTVTVHTEFGGQKRQMLLLIKLKSGKPRLVGCGIAPNE